MEMNQKQYQTLSMVMTGLLLLSMVIVGREAAEYAEVFSSRVRSGTGRFCVVVDAGHGGDDPGKVGINGTLEKDVNLEVARLVKSYLEAEDVKVVMTRDSAEGLYDAGVHNKKVQDMKRRVEIIEENSPDVVVSIHQNSYPEEYVKGAQVFYYAGSGLGEKLAKKIQESLIQRVDPQNHRQVKPNDSYYLLKKTSEPIVIVECGFLSNSEEAAKLNSEEYRKKLAWAIHLGILQYLNEAAD